MTDGARTHPPCVTTFLGTCAFPSPFPSLPDQAVRGNVLTVLEQKDQRAVREALMRDLDLEQVRRARGRLCIRVCRGEKMGV